VIIRLEIDVFALGNINNMMLYFQLFIFLVGQLAPKVIILYPYMLSSPGIFVVI